MPHNSFAHYSNFELSEFLSQKKRIFSIVDQVNIFRVILRR